MTDTKGKPTSGAVNDTPTKGPASAASTFASPPATAPAPVAEVAPSREAPLIVPPIRTLTVDDLEPLHTLEVAAQPLPWSDDQLLLELVNDNALVLGLLDSVAGLVGHVVTRRMVDELWVLNVCVHPAHRRRGYARALFDAAIAHGRERAMTSLWLEVRESNAAARALYAAMGMAEKALRAEYYPPVPPATAREAAVLMTRAL